MSERTFMEVAVAMATKCQSADPTDPKVGAVIVLDGRVVATGFRGTEDHAEKVALDSVLGKTTLHGATVYTTLEPCTKHVRRDELNSCSDRLVAAKVSKVVVGMLDPNQEVCGRGISQLQDHGIEVTLFPRDLVSDIAAMNHEFVRAQRSLRVTFVDPDPKEAVREYATGLQVFKCECTTDPGPNVFVISEKSGTWWPHPNGLVREEGTRWRATPIFGALGVETVHIVRANALGEKLVAYYRKIVFLSEQQRRRFRDHAAARAHIDLLHGDYNGIEIGNLPKGLDSLAKATVRVV